MQRIQTLFASAAVGVLLLGLVTSRFKPGSEMVVTLRQTGYGLPYSMLCYGVALFFCLSALLYSVWTVPWSVRAANWHFGLSVFLVGVFCAASVAADRFKLLEGSAGLAMTVLVAFSFSPVLFLLVQGAFLLDGFRRVWPFLLA
jgi:TctA family transporter